ncbi:MAG: type II CRISPR RNA-guided endonuclease Cas9 [Bacteroidetes bacterium]|nr:type II CRISPR RNA-guided endonuclease Cas9 [Bacteroidota bacterium]
MKKILGLDIGVASIGWAFIELNEDNQNNSILGMGSRIIPLSADENNEFTRGNEQTTNANRRMKRGARRNLQRYKLRKDFLRKALSGAGLDPSPELFHLDALRLYGLRARALTEQISLEELGRLFYMLNQKRGYKSNRKANNEEEQSEAKPEKSRVEEESSEEKPSKPRKKGYLDLIADREEMLKIENITIGQFFFRELQHDLHFMVKNKIFLRSSYIHEFDLIWSKQQEFYPEVLTNELYNKIRNQIIYFQRPLKSQKALVSECRFEKHHKCIPKSSPLFQVFKIWQDINNIKIISYKAFKSIETDGRFGKDRQRDLTLEEKERLFNRVSGCEKLAKKDALDLLGYKAQYDHYGWNIKKDLDGNRTLFSINKVFKKYGIENQELQKFELETQSLSTTTADTETGEIRPGLVIDACFEQQPLYILWHLLYSVDEPAVLHKTLIDKYKLNESQAKALAALDFNKAGYGGLSARAIRKILPYQMEGKIYDKACLMAGYNHSDSITKEENEERLLDERLELLKKGHLRNPVVEKILNHSINLVNAILEDKTFGRPDEIRVELARELTQNAEQRERTFKRNNEADRRHKEIEKRLQEEIGMTRVSKNDIERYKLWEEFGQMSPYQPAVNGGTTQPINLTELFNGSYDVDHIIPRSRVFDDSFQNKVLCSRGINLKKGQMTAFDFMKNEGKETCHSYVELVTQFYKAGKITKAKFNRLMMPSKEIPDDFINRQLNETQYIAKEVKSILTAVCRNVHSTSGSVTDYQRHHWGYDQITQQLNWERFEAVGLVNMELAENGQRTPRIEGWSKREDQRHHAIDALVIASTRQSTIQRLNNLNQLVENKADQNTRDALIESDLLGVKEYVEGQCPFTENQVLKAVGNILVSYKSGKRVAIQNKNTYKHKSGDKQVQITLTPRGYLHKETIYGKIKEKENIKLSTRFTSLDRVVMEQARMYLTTRLEKVNKDPKKAFSAKGLLDMAAELKQKPVPGITLNEDNIEIACFKDSFVLKYALGSIKAKDVPFIVDPVIRRIIRERIDLKGEKDAFKDLENDPVWFNKEKGIQIKRVRLNTGLTDLVPLHKSANGKTFSASSVITDGNSVDYVSTRNNHHIALYRNAEGKMMENVVTFWDALNRKRFGIPIIIKNPVSVLDYVIEKGIEDEGLIENLPAQDWQFITSLQQNEMFIHGLTTEEIVTLHGDNEYNTLSKHLFRVQKIASKYYVLRLHLETKVDDDSLLGQKTGKFLRVKSLEKFNFVKVRLDNLGHIIQIGET